jgi:acyl carrier protein
VDSVQDRVLRVIATTARKPLETVRPESTFEELGIDSLDRLNILFELEGEFDLQIDDAEAKKVTSIHQMVAGVEHLIAVKEAKAADLPEPPAHTPQPAPAASPEEHAESGPLDENAEPGSSHEI